MGTRDSMSLRVVDADSLNPDPTYQANPDPDTDSGFDDQKSGKKYNWIFFSFFFWSTIAIYLTLGLHKGRPSYRSRLQPSKENVQHFSGSGSTTLVRGTPVTIQTEKVNAIVAEQVIRGEGRQENFLNLRNILSIKILDYVLPIWNFVLFDLNTSSQSS